MGTRSMIIIEEEGHYCGVYCHWDGYLEHNGAILLDHYRDAQQVEALIGGGDLSSLAKDLPNCATFKSRGDQWENIKPAECTSLIDMMKVAEGCGCEFVYVFNRKVAQWRYAERGAQFFGLGDGTEFSDFQPLTLAVVRTD